MLVGRDRELSVLDEVLRQGRSGVAGALLLRGEPGIGKSAVLGELAARSGGATVLRTQGSEGEAPLAFAALHRLLRPILRLVEDCPAPQSRALQVALGEQDGTVEPFLVGVAVLGLIAAAAEEQLVVCMVDDVQWLDPASADALLFTTRRLGADRAVLVFAVRDGVPSRFDDQGLDEMKIDGLDDAAARTLLETAPVEIRAADVTDRLVFKTRATLSPSSRSRRSSARRSWMAWHRSLGSSTSRNASSRPFSAASGDSHGPCSPCSSSPLPMKPGRPPSSAGPRPDSGFPTTRSRRPSARSSSPSTSSR